MRVIAPATDLMDTPIMLHATRLRRGVLRQSPMTAVDQEHEIAVRSGTREDPSALY